MPFYAVRHIPTGKYLIPGGIARGGSHTQLQPSRTQAPRLFDSQMSAKISLARYCQGWWGRDSDGYAVCTEEPDNPYRIKSDYELIEVELP